MGRDWFGRGQDYAIGCLEPTHSPMVGFPSSVGALSICVDWSMLVPARPLSGVLGDIVVRVGSGRSLCECVALPVGLRLDY